MKPIDFKEKTKILGKPNSMTHEECGSLAIHNDGQTCISCWQGNWKDRFRFFLTGRMWIGIMSGESQPPIWLRSDTPFEGNENDN